MDEAPRTLPDRDVAPRARIRLLGGFEVHREDGAPVSGLGRRGIALLACLALAEQPWTRDDLAALLWQGRSVEQARGSLRQELLRVRRALDWPAGGPLHLPSHLAEVDAIQLQHALADPARAAEAVALYRGPLLPGFPPTTQEPFTEWIGERRQALHEQVLAVLRAWIGGPQASEALARRLVALDQSCEEAHRFLMRHYAKLGDMGRVLEQFRSCAEAIRAANGAGPGTETRVLLDEITVRLGARAALPAATGIPAVLDWIHHAPDRAPVPTTPPAGLLPVVDDRPSVAVLPFAEISHELLAGGVLAEGLTEEVTNALAHVPGFFVTARQSAMAYRGVAIDVRRIAAELGVRYLVEGSVEHDGRRLRLNLRLLDGRNGLHLWADSQGARLGEAMELRDTVVRQIAARLEPRLMHEEIGRAMRRLPDNPDAWTWLQRANGVLLQGRHHAALERVLGPLERALEADPHYAMAHALAAAVHTWRWLLRSFPDPEAERKLALSHAAQALAIEPDNPFVLTHCAEATLYAAADSEQARVLLEDAMRRNPNDPNGLALLAHVRRQARDDPRECLGLIADALRLSPRDPRTFGWHHYASWCHFRLNDMPGMEAASRRSVGLYGRYPLSWVALTAALGFQNRPEEARAAAATLHRLQPNFHPDGFFEAARATYGTKFRGAVVREYEALRDALRRAFGG
ncbi:BTAD domain-containing putative transcriptional regulator [Falsiroseomonas sp. HW251]|uniref:BTAD domain-containing putative transcriptional regulator n=1 Tax=Falsiroseomonas sp. HW251 TaxID=3390998 RepID=UPI003D3222D8